MPELRLILKDSFGREILCCGFSRLPLKDDVVLQKTKEIYGPNRCCPTRRSAVEQRIREELRMELEKLKAESAEVPFQSLSEEVRNCIRGAEQAKSAHLITM